MPIRVFLRRASQRRRTRLRPNPTEEKDLLDEEQFSATAYFDTTRFRPPYICTAAFQNDLQEARSLQSLGGRKLDINETTWDGFAPIHIAAALGHMEFMKYLLAHPEVEHNKQNDKGNTAFMLAVEHNRREVVELLLDSPFIDVNMHNKKGRNALGLAVVHCDYMEDEIGLFLTLLESDRVDCSSSCGPEGNLSLLVRGRGWPLQLVKEIELNCAILSGDSLNDNLWEAARKGDTRKLHHLLTVRKLDVNVVDRNSNTALILACIYGQAEAVETLLRQPLLDVNIKNRFGNTALAMATYKGFSSVVKLLLANHSIDPNIANEEGANTALHLAIREQSFAVAKLIISCSKTDINLRNERGETPYQQADRLGMQHLASYLSRLPEAKVGTREEDFIEACRMGYEERVHYMLTRKLVDPNVKDGEGNTGLHEAVVYKQYGVMAHLLSCPDLKQKTFNRSRQTPLSLAKKFEDETALHLFLMYKKDKLTRQRSGVMLLSKTGDVYETLIGNGLGNLLPTPEIEDKSKLLNLAFAMVEPLSTLIVYVSDTMFKDATSCAILLAAYRRHIRLLPISAPGSEARDTFEGTLGEKKIIVDLETLDTLAQVGVTETHVRAAGRSLLAEKHYPLQVTSSGSRNTVSQQVEALKVALGL